jgi:predicted RND superfamily exporter protein
MSEANVSLKRLARLQMQRPLLVLLVAAISVVAMGWLASKLSLITAFGELLPQNKESVIIAERLKKRLPSLSTLSVVIEGEDDDKLKNFVDKLAPRLRNIDRKYISTVDSGAKQARGFFEKNRFLYADLDLLREVHDEVEERYAYEVNKAAGFLLEEDEPPPKISEDTIRKRLDERSGVKGGKKGKKPRERYPAYYLDSETHTIAILIRTTISGGDLVNSSALKEHVYAAIDETEKEVGKAGKVGLTGNLITSAETHEQIKNDLAHVGLWGGCLILVVVFLFYLRISALIAMALTVAIGAVWTFGVAYLAIGHLNSSTGFLFSIVVGNGINFGIIYMARYHEARRNEDAQRSALIAHADTWLPTLTAAGAACAAYGSLVVTDFRGFKHFGIIGGSGMLLCWLATYAFLPSILAVSEKVVDRLSTFAGLRAFFQLSEKVVHKVGGLYGRPFAWLASKVPAGVSVAGLVLTAVAAYFAYGFIVDPMEYDMSNIANDRSGQDSVGRVLSRKVDKIVGRQGQDGLAIVTDRLDQVLPLKKALEEVRDKAATGHKPFGQVVTVYSVLPTQQDSKIELVAKTEKRIRKARRRGFVDDKEWKKIEELFPEDELKPLGIEDLPEQVKRSFIEKDGTLGRLVYIVPSKNRSIWDGRYLIEFADGFRETALPDGSVVKGSGSQVIYADMLLSVVEDAPLAILVSLIGTLLVILLAFRARREGFAVMASVGMGLIWLLAILAVWSSEWSTLGSTDFQLTALKLNFLNFVALPITIGVGADYAVNVMQRYRIVVGSEQATVDDVRSVVIATGGPVILCSLTTTLGYSALTLSVNKAIQSFGVAAAAGEICCVLAGVLVLPATLIWLARKK